MTLEVGDHEHDQSIESEKDLEQDEVALAITNTINPYVFKSPIEFLINLASN